jgi:hypothetical protein
MGKKKASEMDKQKAIFIEGATGRGHTREEAEEVFDLMAYFAGYGFNKSHSAAYALITYQTAYLKTHFPVEFTCATLTADKEKIDKVVRTVAEARSMGITVLPFATMARCTIRWGPRFVSGSAPSKESAPERSKQFSRRGREALNKKAARRSNGRSSTSSISARESIYAV